MLLFWGGYRLPGFVSPGVLIVRELGIVIIGFASSSARPLPRWNGLLILIGLIGPVSLLFAAPMVAAGAAHLNVPGVFSNRRFTLPVVRSSRRIQSP